MITLFEDFNSKIVDVFHGSKSCKKFTEFDFNIFPYMYTTSNKEYALIYTYKAVNEKNPECILHFKIDTSKFIDVRKMECKKYTFRELQMEFYKLTKKYIPAMLNQFHNGGCFWELVRRDSSGYLKKSLLNYGINGIIMYEENYMLHTTNNIHEVYVLLNNDSIISEE